MDLRSGGIRSASRARTPGTEDRSRHWHQRDWRPYGSPRCWDTIPRAARSAPWSPNLAPGPVAVESACRGSWHQLVTSGVMVAAEWRRTHDEPRDPRVLPCDGGDRGRMRRWDGDADELSGPAVGGPVDRTRGIPGRIARGLGGGRSHRRRPRGREDRQRADAVRGGRGPRARLDQLVCRERGRRHRPGDERGRDDARRARRSMWRDRRLRFRVGERRDPDRGPDRSRERRDPGHDPDPGRDLRRPGRAGRGVGHGPDERHARQDRPGHERDRRHLRAGDERGRVPDRRRRDLGRRRPERRGLPGRPRRMARSSPRSRWARARTGLPLARTRSGSRTRATGR